MDQNQLANPFMTVSIYHSSFNCTFKNLLFYTLKLYGDSYEFGYVVDEPGSNFAHAEASNSDQTVKWQLLGLLEKITIL